MKKTKYIESSPENLTAIIEGNIDLFFDKSGANIGFVNTNPNNWTLFPDVKNALVNAEDNENVVVLSPKYKVGGIYQYSDKIWIDILDATLCRLEDITEDDALRTGLTKTEKGFKHYCPKKLFPKKLLNKQEPGFPYMENARSSYFTKWVDRYGVLDVSFNPWIWKYKFKININHSFKNTL